MTRMCFEICSKAVGLAVIVSVVLVGCGKKKAETTPTTTEAPADTGATATATAASETTPEQQAPAIVVNNVNTADPKAAMNAAAEALKAKQYEDAAKVMVALQQQRLNEQQAAALHNQMIQLQGAVADGVVRGDASAQAAAEMLRQAARHR